MTLPFPSSDRVLNIHLTLSEYPILSSYIRARMRQQLFTRGVITAEAFETEARQKAIQSQTREGLRDPYGEEASEIWDLRIERIRDHLTDFYYAHNLPYADFVETVRQAVNERGEDLPNLIMFNPELAPQKMLFGQARAIEQLPPGEQKRYEARLKEIKVVLLRTIISDQLAYINIARKWFTVSDLQDIRRRKIGPGKIGGKAAGMLLAERVLKDIAPPEIKAAITTPQSYFLGSGTMYNFMAANGLMHWADQKYKPEEQIRAEYPLLRDEFAAGNFPEEILSPLRTLLKEIGKTPLIIRSSSLLEDNFGTSFAGKYDSFFLPNQGAPEENLTALTKAFALVYASGLNPNVLLYRRQKGLLDYDERMAILIQFVQGEHFGKYFFPQGAGVAFSHNLYRWSPNIRKEDGFVRLVWGLGTRAVDQIGDDYPRMVALSHPTLHPADSTKSIRLHSQRFVDVLDLDANALKSLPIHEVLTTQYPVLRYIAQVDEDGYLRTLHSSLVEAEQLVITFDEFLRRTAFAETMRTILQLLEKEYNTPVDTEFTVQVTDPQSLHPGIRIALLQCRPQSHFEDVLTSIPENLPAEDIVFSIQRMVPRGTITGIRYVVFVPPEAYFQLASPADRNKLERAIGSINAALNNEVFICVGPGRWGTSTPDLGVSIGYGDIYNTRALVELAGQDIGLDLEPSFGTHFFQDLMEARIFPLAIYLDDEDVLFNRDFFYATPNRLSAWIPGDKMLKKALRLIKVDDARPGHSLTIIMDDEQGKAVAFFKPD
ncbi:MAG: PEP/pyruvate-binding domain-containing protein [Chloroflexota bacterium]